VELGLVSEGAASGHTIHNAAESLRQLDVNDESYFL
jgi:uncharacterized protein YoaH (UPF0181 family)